MKRLFFALVFSFIFIFVLWFLVGYVTLGDNIVNYHLDLFSTIRQLDKISNSVNGQYLWNQISTLRSGLQKISDSGFLTQLLKNADLIPDNSTGAFSLLTTLIDPILNAISVVYIGGMLIVIVITFLIVTFNTLIGVYEFIFNPVFVQATIQVGLEKAYNLFGVAFQVPAIIL